MEIRREAPPHCIETAGSPHKVASNPTRHNNVCSSNGSDRPETDGNDVRFGVNREQIDSVQDGCRCHFAIDSNNEVARRLIYDAVEVMQEHEN